MRDNFKKNRKYFKKAPKGGESDSQNSKLDHEPVQAKPLEVRVYNNNFDKALRAFRALVQKERILSAYKENQSYEKPSDKKRRKRNEMRRKLLELDGDFKKPFRARKSDSSE
jgi:small subunit ribosomal protein S21